MSADQIDDGSETAEFFLQVALNNAKVDIPLGEPGECDGCGDWFARTVNGYCGRCRDELRLP